VHTGQVGQRSEHLLNADIILGAYVIIEETRNDANRETNVISADTPGCSLRIGGCISIPAKKLNDIEKITELIFWLTYKSPSYEDIMGSGRMLFTNVVTILIKV